MHKDWYEPIVMPGILTFFGVLVWWMAMMADRKGKPAPWKWIGLILIALAIGFGYGPFADYQDYTYRMGLPPNRRVVVVHYGALVLPVVALIGCVGWLAVGKRFGPSRPAAAE
ncbi:MAG: hypothetical protein QOJ65_1174 [Fimbriimonadaceae bacterium]|jgi:steroid 5-alpha reductase family enzyme|nr:hypothetical protein [Fimbriimonadaceae bacterium]